MHPSNLPPEGMSCAGMAEGPMIGIGKSGITPARRKELANLALSCCALFDEAGVMPHEKCYVGKLCQTLLEF